MSNLEGTEALLVTIDNLNRIIRDREEEIQRLKETISELETEVQLAHDNH